MSARHTIVISDEAQAKLEREADEMGWTVAMFIEWLAESYEPPPEATSDGD